MSRQIAWSQEARADVLRDAYYLADAANLTTSDRFLEAVEKAYKQLAVMPGLGVLRDYGNPALTGMRVWPVPKFPKYLIFYRATDETLEIIRVLHGARDLDAIFAPPSEDE
jgi:toxin ParE1/3/4